MLFFPEVAILCLCKRLPYHHMAGLIQGFCINSWVWPDTSAPTTSSFPRLKDTPPLISNVCHSHQKASVQFWLERNGRQDSCEGEDFAKLGKMDTGDPNFLKI